MRLCLILVLLQLSGNVAVSLLPACSKLPDVPHALLSDDTRRAEYQEGHAIHFICETGYVSGPTIRYLCTNTGWMKVNQGGCNLKPCQLPDETPNGYYQIIHGEEFVFGTTVKYFCNDGYQMSSKEDTRTCYLDRWTNHVPICDPLSCDPPADREITVKGLPDNEDPILPDRFLTFSCNIPGKHLKGNKMLICGKDGQWNHPFPTCEDIACEVDVMHPNITSYGLPSGNGNVKVGQKLNFDCADGYTLEGSEEIQCLETGQWNAPFPTCSENCRIPEILYSVSTNLNPSGQLRQGQKLHFSCRLRGQVIRGKSEVACLANGQWSDPFPTCGAPRGCGQPPALQDAVIKNTLKFSYSHNEKVEYICQRYYTMEGRPFKTCDNGEWTGEMRCLRPCTVDREVMNTHNIRFKFSHNDKIYSAHNDVIEFSCTRGRNDGTYQMRQRCIEGVMNLPSCH